MSILEVGKEFTIGKVITCNTKTFTVDVKLRDIGLVQSVPLLNTYGTDYGNDLTWLTNLQGSLVLLIKIVNTYYVMATVPEEVLETKTENVTPVQEPGFGGDVESIPVDKNYNVNRPTDFYPGDKVLRTDGGAELFLGKVGLARLKASSLAQIIFGKFKDFCKLIARQLSIYTDAGSVETFHTAEGKVGVAIKGGADFAAETHPGVAAWTVQAWIGDATGEDVAGLHDNNPPDTARLHVKVNDAADATGVILTFGTEGNVTLNNTGNFVQEVGGTYTQAVEGVHQVDITGESDVTYMDAQTTTIVGESLTMHRGRSTHMVTGEDTRETQADKILTVGGNYTINVSGLCTINGNCTLAGGTLTMAGTPGAPNGQGPLCAIATCPFSGLQHTTDTATLT